MTMSAADVKKQQEKAAKKGGGSSTPWLKIEAGDEILVRIGPPWKKEGEIWKDVYTHGNGYKDKSMEVTCALNDVDEKSGKKRKCAVEKRLEELKTDRSAKGKKLWSMINQRSKGYWNVAVVEKHKKENGVYIVRRYKDGQFKVLQLSFKWQQLMLDIFANEDYREHSILGVSDPKHGRLIKIRRRGSERDDTVYTFTAVDKEGPIFEDKHKTKKLLETLVDLDKLVHGSSDEEIAAFLHKAEREAKKQAKADKENESGSQSESSSESESASESKSSRSESESASASVSASGSASESASESGGKDKLEKQYAAMKKKLREKGGSSNASESASES